MALKTVESIDVSDVLRQSIDTAVEQADQMGNLPEQLHSELRDAGAFRLLTPREYGGSETPLTDTLQVYERFGRIDASVGLLVWNANFGFIAAMLPESGARKIFTGDREPVLANAGSPGMAEAVDGGYRLSGQWKIVSGIHAADWFIAVGVVTKNGEPVLTDAGGPDVRLLAVQRSQLTVNDTWDVTGMRATGSNDVVVSDAFIQSDLAAELNRPPRIDRPLYRGFIPALVFPGCSAVSIGVAQSAIDELVALGREKKSMIGGTIADAARTQYLVAKSEAALAAARLLLLSAAKSLQTTAERAETPTIRQRADLRAAMTHAADVSRDALVAMYTLASSSALYRNNRIERLFRDGMAALQHANQSAIFLEAAGRVRFGLDPALPLF